MHPDNLQGSQSAGAETRFRSLSDANVVGIIVADPSGRIADANDAFLRMVGYAREDLPLDWNEMAPPELRDRGSVQVRDARETGIVTPFETECRHKDGRRVPSLIGGAYTQGSESECVWIVLDLTERKQAEESLRQSEARYRALYENIPELKRLSSSVVLAEERERQKIARELHDGVAQLLAFARGKLGAFKICDDESRSAYAELRDALDQAIRQMRSLTVELSSPILHELGLTAALQSLGEAMAAEGRFAFQLNADARAYAIADDARIVLYRSARELLTNVVKYAAAGTVQVSLEQIEQTVRLVIADDGCGFDVRGLTEGFSRTGTFGLFSIQQQVEHVGGRFEISSQIGGGTRAVITVPLTEETARSGVAGATA